MDLEDAVKLVLCTVIDSVIIMMYLIAPAHHPTAPLFNRRCAECSGSSSALCFHAQRTVLLYRFVRNVFTHILPTQLSLSWSFFKLKQTSDVLIEQAFCLLFLFVFPSTINKKKTL